MKSLLLFPLLLVLFAACQVKEQASSGGLISGHGTTSNAFTLQTPTSNSFLSGETITLQLTFPYDVTVTGTPQLALTVGATTRYANYSSGTGTTTLSFQYTFVLADNDTDGITVAGLGLNGGTLTFDNNGVTTPCSTTLTARTFSGLTVDNIGPTISGFSLSNTVGFYNKDDSINFTMTFSEAVVVTGNPRFAVALSTGGTAYATYTGGTGSSILGFSFTITNSMADTNGYIITSPIDLNGGTIEDTVGNSASLTFAALVAAVQAYSASVDFDGRLPYVVSVTPPSNGTYQAAQNLDFSVEFDRSVSVTGSPYISLTIGSTIRQATYLSGSGTNTIIYRYIVVPGDVDTDGIAVASSITQNGGVTNGSVAPTNSFWTVAGNNVITVPSTTGVLVSALQPQPTAITRNTDSTSAQWGTALDNKFIIGQELLISVSFNSPIIVSQTGGTPRLPLTFGASTVYANYYSGSGQSTLIFRYVILEGDEDTDGTIAVGDIDLNGGTIMDANGTNSLLTIPSPTLATTYVDGVRPTISSVTPPADGTYSTITGNNHLMMTFTLNWSEAVRYSSTATTAVNIPTTIGATAVNLNYASGNQTAAIVHRASALTGYNDSDGIALASALTYGTATIKDQAGNSVTTFTIPSVVTTGILVDTTAPTVNSVTSPAAGNYTIGDDLDFVVNFSETVNITSAGGYPRIAIALDSGTKYATYLSGTGTTSITFRYTIVASDADSNGITNPTAISIANAPTSYIRDIALNGSTTTSFAMTTNLTGVVIDGVAPTISSRAAPANGTYDSGDTLSFTVNYSESVTVTGTPRIQVAAQTGTLDFEYASGSGTSTLTFSYTVTGSDFDFDGLSSSVTTIGLNGGTIEDAFGNSATLTFAALNLSSVYIAYPNTVLWSTSSFTNQAAVAGLAVSSGGAVSTEACGSGTCRTFNGDDSMSTDNAMASVDTIFIVFKTPAALSNIDLFGTDISLVDDGVTFDITTGANSDIVLDGVSSLGATSHNSNMPTGSFHILQVDFSTPPTIAAGTVIDSTYDGAIGEVIVVTGALTAGQKAAILTYLNAKY